MGQISGSIMPITGYATPKETKKFAQQSSALESNYKEFAGLTLSNVGIGTYLGNTDDQTDKMVTEAIIQSVQSGVNVIDTSINYRSQKAERAVGKAAERLIQDNTATREQLFVCTKSGYVTNDADVDQGFWEYVKQEYTDTGIIKADEITSSYHCMTPEYLSDQIERSLKNLNMDCIDLAYLHNAVEGQIKDVSQEQFIDNLKDAIKMYEKKRAEGVIRYYGMATWECFRVENTNSQYLSLENIVKIAREIGGEDNGFRFVQLPFNLYYDQILLSKHQTIQNKTVSLLDAASKLKIGIFTSVPFMQGRLLQHGTMPEFSDLIPPLRALQFIRSTPGVLAPLVGQKTPEHVSENMKIMNTSPIAQEEFSEIVTKLTSPSAPPT